MYQKIIVVGNLGRDPEMRYMPDGTAVTSFSLATNRSWTNKISGEKVDETTWFRISVWGRQAETANQYLSRGRKALVEGVLTPDRNTGGPTIWMGGENKDEPRASFEIRADNVRFLGGGDEGNDSYSDSGQTDNHVDNSQEEDDIPF